MFYGHHANVDRMWSIWQKLETKRRDYTDPDWLDSSFVLYDENKNAVRIKVRDCVDSVNLGYVYQDVDIPWLNTRQIPRQNPPTSSSPEPPLAPPPEVYFPAMLNSEINTVVGRPSRSRTIEQKGEEDEVLVIEDIEFDRSSRVHFNVLVNVLDEGLDVSPANIEFAGSFRNIPHAHNHNNAKNSLRFVITELIEELGLDDAETLHVKIAPKLGGENVTIGGIKIELQPIN